MPYPFCLQCAAITGLGFRRGSYKCMCKVGYYFPDTEATNKFFNGTSLEEEYAKILEVSAWDPAINAFIIEGRVLGFEYNNLSFQRSL